MTTRSGIAKRVSHGLLCALALFALLACNREPYPLEEGELTGELPDQHIDLEAELANPGEEMHVPAEPPTHDWRDLNVNNCTREELEEHSKSNTHADGRINEEGIVCRKHSTAPATPPAAQIAPSAGQH